MGAGKEAGRHRKICDVILRFYFLSMTVVLPFYLTDGYRNIGEDKYVFYRNISLVTGILIGNVLLLSLMIRREKELLWKLYHQMTVTDWFAYGYFLAVLVSFLCTPYRSEALWGVSGWHMGMLTQLFFLFFYFFFSRYFHSRAIWFSIWMTSSAAVFVLGILNRYSVYPVSLEGRTPVFISTLGNINWYSGYWAVVFPIGVMSYCICKRFAEKFITGIFYIVGVLAGVTQGSDSVFLVFLGMFLFLFFLSFEGNKRLYAFLELCILFSLSCQLGRVLRYLPAWEYNYETVMGRALTDSGLTIWIFTVAAMLYLLFFVLERKRGFRIERCKKVRKAVVGIVAIGFAVYITAVIYCTYADGAIWGNSFFLFNENWGNGRGAAWKSGIAAFSSFGLLHKVVGIGPDCFAAYCYGMPDLAEKLICYFGKERLTNAHNEWLTVLVNSGVIGLFCYAGIFLSAVKRFLTGAKREPLLYLCAASALAYMAHCTVSFQQVLSTPYIFIVLGMGEGLLKSDGEEITKK